MFRKSAAFITIFLMLAAAYSPAHAQHVHAGNPGFSQLQVELSRQNAVAGNPLTAQQINEFCAFMTEPKADGRQTPSIDVGLYDSPGPATDRSIALGARIPLILVHGSGSDVLSDGELGRPLDDLERWRDYLAAFNADSAFYDSYKVYRFVYDSRLSVDENGANLISVIDNIGAYPGWAGEDLDGRSFVLLAHSMGGLVSRAALNKQFTLGVDAGAFLGASVLNLVTLGTPHHGSPAAVPAWIYDSVLRGAGMTKEEFSFLYVQHWGFDPTDGAFDLAWDNYDDGLPLNDISTYRGLFIPAMNGVGGGRDAHLESLLDPYPLTLNSGDAYIAKLVIYCAENPPNSNVDTLLDLSFYYLLGTLNEHHLMGYAYNKLGQLIAGDLGEGDTKPYVANDGLVPSTSSLFEGAVVAYGEILDNCDHLSLLDKATVIGIVKSKLLEIVTIP